MPRRTLKQFAYASGFLIVLFAVGYSFYFLNRPPQSCTNARADRGEEGVDCGGVCAVACIPVDLEPLFLREIRVFHAATGTLGILSRIQNSNPDWAAPQAEYFLDLFADGDTPVASLRKETYMYAGEIKNAADFWQDPAAGRITRAELRWGAIGWAPAARFAAPRITLQSKSVATSTQGIEVQGRVVSADTVTVSGGEAVALFYDRFGFLAGVSRITFGALTPGESLSFTILHPFFSAFDPQRTEVYVYALRPVL